MAKKRRKRKRKKTTRKMEVTKKMRVVAIPTKRSLRKPVELSFREAN
jgi:hypothetical protein